MRLRNENRILAYTIGTAFFFCVFQYRGIIIDAMLYTLQAVRYMRPDRLTGDIAFVYGNQDSFSFFSPLYCAFIKLFSIELGGKIFCVVTHLLLSLASIKMFDVWTRLFHCKFALIPLILFFFYLYGFGEGRSSISVFHFVEPYINPRNLSVALGILGLAYLFNRKWASFLFFFCGTLIHPLMAGWGLPLWLFFYYPKTIFYISLFSALFPLTIFIGRAPFCSLDAEWSIRSPYGTHFVHFASCALFFLFNWKTIENRCLKNVSRALFFIVTIALYWQFFEHFTGHAFLTQVQTYRVEWICIITVFPICFIRLYNVYVCRIRKEKTITVWDKVAVAFPFAFWIDSLLIDCLLVTFLLYVYLKNNKKEFILKDLLLGLQVVCLIGLLSIFVLNLLNLSTIDKITLDNIREYVSFAAVLVAFIGFVFYSKRNRISWIVLAVVSIMNFFHEKSMFSWNVFYTISLMAATLMWLKNTQQTALRLVPLVWLVPYIVLFYDVRCSEQIEAEKEIDYFWEHPIFPQIKNRGSILFNVNNYHIITPRLHYVTGAYLDNQSVVGGLFFREQHLNAVHRFNMMFLGDSSSSLKRNWRDFNDLFEELHDYGRLSTTARFLCDNEEISYIATDIESLDFHLVDKMTPPGNPKSIFLYSCKG